jgi:ParB-like chromosome segregation protein Spo0J
MTDLKKRLLTGDYRVETWPLDRIVRYANNPRKNDAAVEKTAASIKRFGWRQPIVVDKEGVIVAGDTRFMAARLLQLAGAPVHVADDLTDDEARAYRLADNRTNEEAEWDDLRASEEMRLLESANFDLSGTGFDSEEIEKLLGDGKDATLEPVTIREPPRMTWVLVGIQTTRYADIADHVEKIAAVDGIFCEVSAADEKK